jgi:UDP-glucose 4-epimerase
MTTLITGAGLVGSLAAARLIAERDERPILYDVGFSLPNVSERVDLDKVTLVRGDVTDVPDLVRAIQTYSVDRIIHSAGMLTWMVRERPYTGVRVNLMGTLAVYEAARLTGVQRVVFCSSNTVHLGTKGGGTEPEGTDFALHTVSEYPPSVYASMKLAGEWLGHCYRQEYGVDVVSVRFAGVFGPWHGTPSGGPSQLLQQVIECAYYGRPCRLSAGDLDRRATSYVHAADAAQGTVRGVHAAEPTTRVYNIAMPEMYTLRQIVEMTEHLADRKLQIEELPSPSLTGYSDTAHPPPDLRASEAELGYRVEYPMERAIRDYLAWLERTAPR